VLRGGGRRLVLGPFQGVSLAKPFTVHFNEPAVAPRQSFVAVKLGYKIVDTLFQPCGSQFNGMEVYIKKRAVPSVHDGSGCVIGL
jgi:hypothetical protein